MGFFSSIAGSVLGSVASSVVGGLFGGGGGGGGSSSGGSGFSMTDLIGPALQVGGNLIGGKMENDSNEEINAHNLRLAQDQIEWQRQYAHNRLQWQVEDAQKAGLHPMVGAGLSPVSFSPVSANLTPNNYDWVGNIGQSLNYAATKSKTRTQQGQMFDLQLQGLALDNEYKRAQIDLLKVDALASAIASDQALNSPAAPDLNSGRTLIGGQGDSPFMDKPIVRDGWLMDERGRKIGIIPSEPLSSRTEDKLVVEWIPWAGSAVRAFKGKWLGQEVAGHWWHGEDKGFLPYPPKKRKGFFGHASDAINFYRDYGD